MSIRVLPPPADALNLDPNRLAVGQETISRTSAVASTIPTGNQSLRLAFFTARKSEPAERVRVVSGGTAAGATPTLVRVGLYEVADNGDLTLVAATTNDTSVFAAMNTAYTRSLSGSYMMVKGQRYAVGVLVVTGATAPTLMGMFAGASLSESAAEPRLAGVVSGQSDLPSFIPAESIGNSINFPYAVILPA